MSPYLAAVIEAMAAAFSISYLYILGMQAECLAMLFVYLRSYNV